MHTFKKIFRRATRGEILLHFFRRASRGAAWPLHFKFVSYAYALAVSPQNGLKRSEILGGHVPTCHTPLARALRALYAISHVHTGTPLFKILDPPLQLHFDSNQTHHWNCMTCHKQDMQAYK